MQNAKTIRNSPYNGKSEGAKIGQMRPKNKEGKETQR
jgi:hypothetical protein